MNRANTSSRYQAQSALITINSDKSLISQDFKSLVIGDRFQNEDFRCSAASFLGKFSSGVLGENSKIYFWFVLIIVLFSFRIK